MSFSFKDFFSKSNINESELDLSDIRWSQLEGGYLRLTCDASIPLSQLQAAKTSTEAANIYTELWDMLHHQGDVSVGSYYAVPHLVRIAKENKFLDYNVFCLVAVIEVQRHQGDRPIPKLLLPNYNRALQELSELAKNAMSLDWDAGMASSVLAAIAVAKGKLKLASALIYLDSEDVIDEFIEQI